MKIKINAITDIGKERDNNEDAFAICSDLTKCDWTKSQIKEHINLGALGAVLIVADGMGGEKSGEIASSIAVEELIKSFNGITKEPLCIDEKRIHEIFMYSFETANRSINEYVSVNPDSVGLGTTIVVLWIYNNEAYVAWCGDSRCYRFNRKSGLKLITKDHSLVQEMIDKGEINEIEAFNHPDSNVITRCLGDVDTVTKPEIISCKVAPNDIFLLCTDGLCGYCTNEKIEKVLYQKSYDLDLCKKELLDLALDSGGFDNITIALCSTLSEKEENFYSKIKRLINGFFIKK